MAQLALALFYDDQGHKMWEGHTAQRELITVRSPGDQFKDWITGWIWGVMEEAGPWVQIGRLLPEQRKINPDDYTL